MIRKDRHHGAGWDLAPQAAPSRLSTRAK